MEDFITGLTAKATALAADLGTIAVAALVVLAVTLGVRYGIRIFRAVK